MLTAVFLDMDETLCDTKAADNYATAALSKTLAASFPSLDTSIFSSRYVQGFYKQLNHEFPELLSLLPDEKLFRQSLIKALFAQQQITISDDKAAEIHDDFNRFRFEGFDFYPNTQAMLKRLREQYTLVVITNGPTFSQYPKIAKVKLSDYVDHIIVGGEEPAEKPALSIFAKALKLADCDAQNAIHVGDSFACDIKGAAGANIASIWIAPEQAQAANPEADIATYCINSYADIETTIDQHAKKLAAMPR